MLLDKNSEKEKTKIRNSELALDFNIVPNYKKLNRKKINEIIAVKMLYLANQIKNVKKN